MVFHKSARDSHGGNSLSLQRYEARARASSRIWSFASVRLSSSNWELKSWSPSAIVAPHATPWDSFQRRISKPNAEMARTDLVVLAIIVDLIRKPSLVPHSALQTTALAPILTVGHLPVCTLSTLSESEGFRRVSASADEVVSRIRRMQLLF